MKDLVDFLRARLDEDKQTAQAATAGPWSYNPGKMWLDGEAFESFDRLKGEEYVAHGGPSPFTGCVAATGPADHPQSMADAAFIARHDPAWVLREVEAKRRIIEAHVGTKRYLETDEHDAFNKGMEAGLELAIRMLALPYADHPDYRNEWRP